MRSIHELTIILPLILTFNACHTPGQREKEETVHIHKTSDPSGLNPVSSSGSEGLEIKRQLFQKLIDHHPYHEKLVPILAQKVPEVEIMDDSTVRVAYRIRDEARWDDGSPITACDVAFTLKAGICPGVKNGAISDYLSVIQRIEYSKADPKRIIFYCERYIRALYSTGAELGILPIHQYDPDSLLASIPFKKLLEHPELIENKPGYEALLDRLNAKGIEEGKRPVGSGPYRIREWKARTHLTLERKKDWWGDRVEKASNPYFNAFPSKIVHHIITDKTSAIQALKKQKLDAMDHIPADRYEALGTSSSATAHIHRYVAPQMGYSYLTFHTDDPILQDPKLRKALARLVHKERIRKDLTGGHGKFLVGPVHPAMELYYNDTLSPYRYAPEKASKILEKSGWKDADGDGVRERRIHGKERELNLSFLYNSGSETRKKVGVLLKESAAKAGVGIELHPAEWSNYNEKLGNGSFQIAIGGFVFSNAPQDPKQLFHTSAMNGGSNYAGFGNARTDRLIDSIRRTMDPQKRKSHWYKLQEVIHREVPMIFLQTAVNRIAINRRFGKVRTSRVIPGYWAPGFRDTSKLTP